MSKDYNPEDLRFPDQTIVKTELVEEMENSYIDYAMSVIVGRALPGGLTDLFLVLGAILFCLVFELPEDMMGTICTVILCVVGLMVVHRTCKPYDLLRRAMMVALVVGFGICVLVLPELFTTPVCGSKGPTPWYFSGCSSAKG